MIGGVFLTLGLLYWWDIRKIGAEARLVRQAFREVPRVDGQRVAVIGTVELEGGLQAPFSDANAPPTGTEALRPGRPGRASTILFFFGWRIAPLAVRTPGGDVHLLASFDKPGGETRTEDMDYANAAEYFAATAFSPAPELGAGTLWDLSELRTQVPPVRADYARRTRRRPTSPRSRSGSRDWSGRRRVRVRTIFGRARGPRPGPPAPVFAIDLRAGEPGNVPATCARARP